MDVFWPMLLGGVAGVAVAAALIMVVNGLVARKMNGRKKSATLKPVVDTPSVPVARRGHGLRPRAA